MPPSFFLLHAVLDKGWDQIDGIQPRSLPSSYIDEPDNPRGELRGGKRPFVAAVALSKRGDPIRMRVTVVDGCTSVSGSNDILPAGVR